LARSRDNGRTWTFLPSLSLAEGVPYSVAMTMSNGGVLAVAFTKKAGQDYRGTFVGVLVGNGWRVSEVDPAGGLYPAIHWGRGATANQLFVVYPKVEGETQTPMLRSSRDHGRTWSHAVALDTSQGGGATVPSLAVDGVGWAFSGFYHPTPGGGNEYRVSAWDGARVRGPVTVSDSRIGHQDLALSLGHYMGIAGLDFGASLTWVAGGVPSTSLVGARVLPVR
jgi:hypothetical protein